MRQTIEYMAQEATTQEEQEVLMNMIKTGLKAVTESGIEYLKIKEG